ncbi:MAG: outer rane efflux protein [Myxococcaceae bacterium]|nr:outer rane efflux protein [Myxococcaceae bacterium]
MAPPTGAAIESVNLQQALEQALRREPRIEVAIQEVSRSEALLEQSRASWLPTLQGNGVYTRLDHDRRAGATPTMPQGSITLTPANSFNMNLSLFMPLIAPQRWTNTNHFKNNVLVARESVVEVRRQVTLATARAYLSIVAQQRVIDVNERAYDNARAHYEYAHARFMGGIGTELDDVRAGQELAQNEAQLEQSRASLVMAQEALGVLLGRAGPVDASAPEALSTDIEQPDTNLIDQRGDVRTGHARVRAADKVVHDNYADYMPLIYGTAQAFFQDPKTVQFPRTGWQAQLVLSIPFYDGGLRYGLADERRALLAQSRTQLEATLRQAKSEVRVAFATLVQADKSLAAANRGVDLARRALQMANLAYRAGATTDIEVVDAERRSRDAETSAVIAEDTARRARLELLIASDQLP